MQIFFVFFFSNAHLCDLVVYWYVYIFLSRIAWYGGVIMVMVGLFFRGFKDSKEPKKKKSTNFVVVDDGDTIRRG